MIIWIFFTYYTCTRYFSFVSDLRTNINWFPNVTIVIVKPESVFFFLVALFSCRTEIFKLLWGGELQCAKTVGSRFLYILYCYWDIASHNIAMSCNRKRINRRRKGWYDVIAWKNKILCVKSRVCGRRASILYRMIQKCRSLFWKFLNILLFSMYRKLSFFFFVRKRCQWKGQVMPTLTKLMI